jgi:lipopolysaccharide export system protein LptA
VAARDIGRERARRQKWLTRLVIAGLSITALVLGLTYRGGEKHQTARSDISSSPAPNVNQQLSGYTFTRNDQGRPVFTVHAAKTVSYQENKSTELEDVTVEVFGRKGDSGDILRTHRCEYLPQSGDFLTSGPVQIELSAHSSDVPGAGLRGKHRAYLETSKVAYHQSDEMAETDEHVKFHTGPISGTALGMLYATRDGWVELKHDVRAELAQGTPKAPRPPVNLSATALRYDKESGIVDLTGPVEVVEGTRRAASENASVKLDNHDRISQVNLEGHTQAFDNDQLRAIELDADRVEGDFDLASGQLRHITAENNVLGKSKSKGSISTLTAQRFEMDLTGKPPQPIHGVAKGDVHINLESQPVLDVTRKTAIAKGPEMKTLTAAEVRFDFRSETRGLKDAETVGPGTLVITPADPSAGQRIIHAGQFLMAFDGRSRIESLRGLAPTQVLFHPPLAAPVGSPTQQGDADRLDALFETATQTLREVQQTGNFQYQDGDHRASADDAHFDAQTQTLLLLGHPQVWDPDNRVKCQRITMDLRTNTSTGEGKVQGTHLQTPAPGTPSGPSNSTLPTNVLADRMVVQRQSQTIHYEGHVRAWQGTNVVESTALDVYRSQKRLSSGFQVVTTFLQPAPARNENGGVSHSSAETRPVTVHADFLDYIDQGRRARYHSNVVMVTENTTLRCDRMDVYFTQGDTVEGSEVERAEADGHVKVTQPGRIGSGEHAEYFAGPGKIILSGGEPSLVDEQKGSTTGQRLTFFIHDDRLFVDGGQQMPSVSKHRVAQ